MDSGRALMDTTRHDSAESHYFAKSHMKTAIKLLPIALFVLPLSVGAASLYGNTEVMVNSGSGVSVGADVDVTGSAGNQTGSAKTDTAVDVTVDASGNQVQTSNDANVSAQFKLFADDIEAQNENVEAVEANGDGSVEVAYRHEARFLGFIPMKVTSHTTVKSDADGNVSVTVRLPWWSFLVGGVSKVENDIETSLKANAQIKAGAGAQVSNETRAQIVNAIVASLNAEAAATAQAEASAKAN